MHYNIMHYMYERNTMYMSDFVGNLLDESEALNFLLDQLDTSSIEEVTGAMLERLVIDTRHLVTVFCKYLGFVIIAVTHTCYLLRHYSPPPPQPPPQPPPPPPQSSMIDQKSGSAAKKTPLPAPQPPQPPPTAKAMAQATLSEQSFFPPERVRGLARES